MKVGTSCFPLPLMLSSFSLTELQKFAEAWLLFCWNHSAHQEDARGKEGGDL